MLVGAAAGAWYLFVRQAGPPPVVLAGPSPGATSPDGDGSFTADSIDGTWSVEIEKPQAMIVLSVQDGGTLELQLQLTRG